MQKEAEAQAIVNDRVEILEKYASAATELLANENFADGFTEGDVVELATKMIASDLDTEKTAELAVDAKQVEMDKVAEAIEYADFVADRVMARIKSELGN